ncbi:MULTISPECIES: tautomerase family protein [Gordonia]|uniref:tautomerase family protein n=1 Tax=Gordonia TaxID=2053 RepID=UPI00200B8DB7|nr:tautomerase family protein [Gordonia terrae]UPW11879.1 tautomerase family protein [Gordonia terrae]
MSRWSRVAGSRLTSPRSVRSRSREGEMPFIDVTIAQGRSPDEVRALMRELTAAAHRAIGAPVANIRVCVREVPPTHWSAGDVTVAERQATISES